MLDGNNGELEEVVQYFMKKNIEWEKRKKN